MLLVSTIVNRISSYSLAAGVLLITWCAVIFILSSFPGSTYPSVNFPFADKFVHLAMYTTGGFLAAMYFIKASRPIAYAIAFGICYGIGDEIHQLFVPGRAFAAGDIAADALGTILGVAVFQFIVQHRSYTSLLTIDKANRMEIG